jgi:hypothetical protein
MFAAKAGARKVYGIEFADIADYVFVYLNSRQMRLLKKMV